MKTKNLILSAILVLALGFVSCTNDNTETKEYLITFEDVELGEDGYWNGSDESGKFESGEFSFLNTFSDWGGGMTSWNGFACSSKTDITTPGFGNQYSAIAGKGANNSEKFAIAFDNNATIEIPQNENGYFSAKSITLTNSTYAYLYIAEGKDGYNQTLLPYTKEDWFKVIITGYKNKQETRSVEYYLANEKNGKIVVVNTWQKVDISSLGEVDKIVFTFDSTDKSEYDGVVYLNTPAYVCIDNILFTQEVEK